MDGLICTNHTRGEKNFVKKFGWKFQGCRLVEKARHSWLDIIKTNLKYNVFNSVD